MQITKIKTLRRHLPPIDVDGEELHISYTLGKHDTAYRAITTVPAALEHLEVAWDVLDEDGKPIPVTVEALKAWDLPWPFLRAVLDACDADASPNVFQPASN